MPLPDAEPPDQSRLYEELKSKTALPGITGAVTADLIDNLKNATFLDADNEDQLRRLVLLMSVTGAGSLSGPMADTPKAIANSVTGDASLAIVFQPGLGEVWELDTASVTHSGGAGGSIRTRLLLEDTTNGGKVEIGDESFASNTNPFEPKGNYGPVRITSDVVLKQTVTGTTGGNEETSEVNISVTRVR
jgi:hypothetical protein